MLASISSLSSNTEFIWKLLQQSTYSINILVQSDGSITTNKSVYISTKKVSAQMMDKDN